MRRFCGALCTGAGCDRAEDAFRLHFPLPDSLAKSWLLRWNEFSPLQIPEDLSSRVRAAMLVSAYQLETVPVRYGKRLSVGCTGQLTRRSGELAPPDRAAFDLLCAYAVFAGSGQHTAQGMGVTLPVDERGK
jgi:CRISPR/Cas system endoribonuclease Cas6 (RAMP superfamily)